MSTEWGLSCEDQGVAGQFTGYDWIRNPEHKRRCLGRIYKQCRVCRMVVHGKFTTGVSDLLKQYQLVCAFCD